MKNRLYEIYHRNTSFQKKIIQENNFTYRHTINILRQYLGAKKIRVLDIGCGAGTLSLYIANKGHKVEGIDISKNAIKSAIKSSQELNLKNVKFVVRQFPFNYPKTKFDLVIFSEVIEHLEDDNLALKIISKLVRKNGYLILTTPSKNAPLYKLGLLENFDHEVGHLRRYTISQLVNLCKNNGFKVISIKKNEGIIRNFLFTNKLAGKSVRFVKFFISDVVTWIDNISLKIFGESNLILVLKKK